MRYEWDSEKDAQNRRKHGLGLDEGITALKDPDCVSWIDRRFDYGEERILNLGRVNLEVRFVVITELHEEYWYYRGLP